MLGFVSALTVSVLDKVGMKQLGLDGVIQQESKKVVRGAQTAFPSPSLKAWGARALLLQCGEACSSESWSWPEEGINTTWLNLAESSSAASEDIASATHQTGVNFLFRASVFAAFQRAELAL